MTEDNDIIKALECCYNRKCYLCPYCDDEDMFCDEKLMKDAFEFFKRQKADNERLQKQLVFEIESAYDRGAKAAIKEFAERLCEGRVSNDPVVIAVKVELEIVGEKNGKTWNYE